MKYLNYIVVLFITFSSIAFSQQTFSNIDSLLVKNFRAVNQNDYVYYLTLLNQNEIFKNKNAKTKADSLHVLNPFNEAFLNSVESFKELVLTPEVTIAYVSYEGFFKSTDLSQSSGKIRLKVHLVLNDSFLIKFVMDVNAHNGTYYLDSPLYFMYIVEEE